MLYYDFLFPSESLLEYTAFFFEKYLSMYRTTFRFVFGVMLYFPSSFFSIFLVILRARCLKYSYSGYHLPCESLPCFRFPSFANNN